MLFVLSIILSVLSVIPSMRLCACMCCCDTRVLITKAALLGKCSNMQTHKPAAANGHCLLLGCSIGCDPSESHPAETTSLMLNYASEAANGLTACVHQELRKLSKQTFFSGKVRSNWYCWKECWMTYSMVCPVFSILRMRLSRV